MKDICIIDLIKAWLAEPEVKEVRCVWDLENEG